MHIRLYCLYSFLLLTGCQSSGNLISPPSSGEEIRYSAIYLIHADANYLYHDEDGNAHRADEKVLAEAQQIGEKAEYGEVFIFHQKPERKILWLFPRKDRRMLHYRNGKLVNDARYSPNFDNGLLSAEADIFKQNQSDVVENSSKILLYFGHEIPVKGGTNYHYSQRSVPVNSHTFSEGAKKFLKGSKKIFDLAVLSTCNNGNPQMAQVLQPVTKTLLASPQNLHLSHIDTDALLLMEEERKTSGEKIAGAMAGQTFNRLSEILHTEITLFVYDMKIIESYLAEFNSLHQIHLEDIEPQLFEENVDCAELPLFNESDFTKGVQGWHKKPQFGRRSNSKTHSGWGCRKN
ncbi:MAG: hypothetical protein WD059_05770 [Balneolaceae bacterium]